MLRLLLTAPTALALTSPGLADEVRDVLLLPGERQVWIAVDGAPNRLDVEAAPGRLVLTLAEFQPRNTRDIRAWADGPVESLTVTTDGRLVLTGAFGVADAQLREGGVLVRFDERWDAMADAGRGEAPQTFTIEAPQPQEEAPPQTSMRAASVEAAGADASAADGTADRAMNRAMGPERSGAGTPASQELESPGMAEQDPMAIVQAGAAEQGPCDETAAVIASSPWDLDALARHAACLAEIGERDNAAGLYERVLAFEPGHFQAALGLAQLREAQGRRVEAARLFEAAAGSARTDGQALAARQSAARLRDGDG